MTRWFYNDPLAAAWMAKHFGMQLTNESPTHDGRKNGRPAYWRTMLRNAADDISDRPTHFCIHPDSLHLLMPVYGDVLMQNGSAYVWSKFGGQNVQSATIIQRNGTPFMWPEVEP